MARFSSDRLEDAFRELSWEPLPVRVHIVVGAAMALGFDTRRETIDVDGLISGSPAPEVDAVRRFGRRRGWPETWLDEEAVSAMPRDPRTSRISPTWSAACICRQHARSSTCMTRCYLAIPLGGEISTMPQDPPKSLAVR